MPLLRQRRFPRSRRSVGRARLFAVETLVEWGRLDRQDDVRLCVSELATNAVLHGVPPGRQFCLSLIGDGSSVRVEVRDSGGGRPQVSDVDVGECGGRGLRIVMALADGFGVTPHNPGKTVWAVFGTRPVPLPVARDGGARPVTR
ncbi:regulatory protein [Streptomyces sp. Tu 6176]|uniref:ATP-binding protein n=1 Tax=Streptomyces sp. Tu 6176 TaxID=1470557 RepID=UPI000447AA8A|nr:ATP-binding protein [Streptomyces sp. Tu 6176]EYT81104.1 regulatory protein [Streptomyces sp. Tu 6176]